MSLVSSDVVISQEPFPVWGNRYSLATSGVTITK